MTPPSLLPLRIAAGMGAPTHDVALAGCVARALAHESARTVRWRVLARSGAA